MSDYIKITNYAAKDALLTGNPSKLVKGTEIGADFDAVAVAVATKVDETSGSATNLTLVTPTLGTPASGTLTNCTGLPAAGVTGTALVTAAIGTTVQAYDADLTTWAGVTPGTGVATALAVNVGSAGAPVVNGGVLGTPSSGTLTNCTNLPAAGVTGTALVSAAIGTTVQAYDADIPTVSASQAEMEAGTEIALRSMSPLRVKQAIAALASSGFPSGTAMLFVQTAAPTGWTKSIAHNDKALRVVSGTVGSGGSSAFSTVFGKTASDGFTLTTSHMPSHNHQEQWCNGQTDPGTPAIKNNGGIGGVTYGIPSFATNGGGSGGALNTVSTGSGSSHSHGMDIRVQYVDFIIAMKD